MQNKVEDLITETLQDEIDQPDLAYTRPSRSVDAFMESAPADEFASVVKESAMFRMLTEAFGEKAAKSPKLVSIIAEFLEKYPSDITIDEFVDYRLKEQKLKDFAHVIIALCMSDLELVSDNTLEVWQADKQWDFDCISSILTSSEIFDLMGFDYIKERFRILGEITKTVMELSRRKYPKKGTHVKLTDEELKENFKGDQCRARISKRIAKLMSLFIPSTRAFSTQEM